jgi:amino acid transporter
LLGFFAIVFCTLVLVIGIKESANFNTAIVVIKICILTPAGIELGVIWQARQFLHPTNITRTTMISIAQIRIAFTARICG